MSVAGWSRVFFYPWEGLGKYMCMCVGGGGGVTTGLNIALFLAIPHSFKLSFPLLSIFMSTSPGVRGSTGSDYGGGQHDHTEHDADV